MARSSGHWSPRTALPVASKLHSAQKQGHEQHRQCTEPRKNGSYSAAMSVGGCGRPVSCMPCTTYTVLAPSYAAAVRMPAKLGNISAALRL